MNKNPLLPFFALFSIFASAQPEFPDTTFGTDGYFCGPPVYGATLFGDMVRVGDDFYGMTSFNNYHLLKFDSNGNPDTAFGTNGVYTLGLYTSGGELHDMTNAFVRLTPDNKLLVVGDKSYPVTLPRNFMSLRNPDGSPVTSFGDNGFVSAAIAWEYIDFLSADIDDGNIILSGNAGVTEHFEILKFDLNGIPAAGFGESGVLRFPYVGDNYILMHGCYDPTQNVLYGLYTPRPNFDGLPYLEKYDLATQAIDTDFGTSGKLYIEPFGVTGDDFRTHMVFLDDDGRIYVSGTHNVAANYLDYYLFIYRYDNTLQPDLSFANQGHFITDVEPGPSGPNAAVMIQSGEYLTLAGHTYKWESEDSYEKPFILSLNLDGTPQQDFGNDGIIVDYTFPDLPHFPYAISRENDLVTIATQSVACTTGFSTRPTAMRFNGAGTLSSAAQDLVKCTAWPNPTTGLLHIESPLEIESAVLFDTNGRVVITSGDKRTIDVTGIENGLYFLTVLTPNGQTAIKICKQ